MGNSVKNKAKIPKNTQIDEVLIIFCVFVNEFWNQFVHEFIVNLIFLS